MTARILRILVFPALLGLGLWCGRGGATNFAGHLPECRFHERTGLHCPGCGGTMNKVKDPDIAVQERLNFVFQLFLKLSTVARVMRMARTNGVSICRAGSHMATCAGPAPRSPLLR